MGRKEKVIGNEGKRTGKEGRRNKKKIRGKIRRRNFNKSQNQNINKKRQEEGIQK